MFVLADATFDEAVCEVNNFGRNRVRDVEITIREKDSCAFVHVKR